MASGAKFSTSTSALRMSSRRTRLPLSVLRSTTIPRLLRFIIRKAAVSSPILGGIMWRESSPSGFFSTLITSAPMSASISVQVGPAITWVRSMTLSPASGPAGGCGAAMAIPPTSLNGNRRAGVGKGLCDELRQHVGDLLLVRRPVGERNQRHVLVLDRQAMQLAARNHLVCREAA